MFEKTIVSEYVSYGHPDKIADQISDAILDEFLKVDPNTRAGIEVMVKDNIVVLGGEINSKGKIDYDTTVRNVINDIQFPESHNLRPENIKIINLIGKQSPEISELVDQSDDIIGAGDQGFMVGFASDETDEYLPLGVYLSKHICDLISPLSSLGLGPDMKSQVIVYYDKDNNAIIRSILISTMQQGDLENDRETVKHWLYNHYGCTMNRDLFEKYVLNNQNLKLDINPKGSWKIGGPISDCGVTGRKIVVDQFGGYCNVGGGSLCSKDGDTKVDRSGAYAARYLAKNIVAAGLSNTAKVELSYVIGIPEPSSINIELNKNHDLIPIIKEYIKNNINLTPKGISDRFVLKRPIYYETARNGHYGNKNYPWEKLDLINDLKKLI